MSDERPGGGPQLGDVAETLIIPLYCRALETRSAAPILRDPRAVEILEALRPELERSDRRLSRAVARGAVPRPLVTILALRARRFDRHARAFLASRAGAERVAVVSLGCGLDARFERVDDGRVSWFDLDLPEVIAHRRRFFEPSERYRMVEASVTEHGWMDLVRDFDPGAVLFLAEGLLMYLEEHEVRRLVLALARSFPGSELVAELFSAAWLPWMSTWLLRMTLRHEFHMPEQATFRFGVRASGELEGWGEGIELLEDWTFFDDREPKLWFMSLLSAAPFAQLQWVAHYRLGAARP